MCGAAGRCPQSPMGPSIRSSVVPPPPFARDAGSSTQALGGGGGRVTELDCASSASAAAADHSNTGSAGSGGGDGSSGGNSSLAKLQEQVASVHTYVAATAEKTRLIEDLRAQLVTALRRQQSAEAAAATAIRDTDDASLRETKLATELDVLREAGRVAEQRAVLDRRAVDDGRAQLQNRLEWLGESVRRLEHEKSVLAASLQLTQGQAGTARQAAMERDAALSEAAAAVRQQRLLMRDRLIDSQISTSQAAKPERLAPPWMQSACR